MGKKCFAVTSKTGNLYTDDYSTAEEVKDKMRRVDKSAEILFGTPGHWESLGGIQIEGHRGTWYVIDAQICTECGGIVFLLESELYGDEAPCLIVDQDKNIILEEVYNGFEDLEEFYS